MLPSGALPVFPHCPSSVCSRRSATYISSLPQQCSLQQEPLPPAPPRYPTPPSISSLPQQCLLQQEPPPPLPPLFSHCRSSACSSRSLSPPPPPSPLPNSPHATMGIPPPAVFFTTAVVPALAGTFSLFSPLPQ